MIQLRCTSLLTADKALSMVGTTNSSMYSLEDIDFTSLSERILDCSKKISNAVYIYIFFLNSFTQ